MKEQTFEGRGSQAERRTSICPETNMADVAVRPVCLKHTVSTESRAGRGGGRDETERVGVRAG